MSLPGGEEDASWRRLSARMLLVHPIRELGQLMPALIGLVVAGRAVGKGQMWWLGPMAVVVIIVLSVLRWMTTRYRITPEQIQLRTGLLRRKTITTAADRVRSVDVTASALHRVLGLAKVDIGTGSHDRGSGLLLDSLSVAQAAGLRAELLHRSAGSVGSPAAAAFEPATVEGGSVSGSHGTEDHQHHVPGTARHETAEHETAEHETVEHETAERDTELARMDPRWLRFAPFTMSGVIGAAATLGLAQRLLDQLGVSAGDVGPIRGGLAYAERTPVGLDVLGGLVALAFFVTVLSIGGYALSYWGYRLTRHPRGSLHITRGLLTTRATSIEERRLRGVELSEPLALRAVHAARLNGITTGLRSKGGTDGGSSLLLPPAPVAVAREVATEILRDGAPVDAALIAHGPAARRRRFVRVLLAVLVVLVAAGAAIAAGAPQWLALPALVTVPGAVLLGADRYRSLGHAVAGRFLVTRAGSIHRRRDVLELEGIIGWNLHQSFFQRRAGLATLTATTAAGRQRYAVTDVPLSMALALAGRVLPGLLGDFLEPDKN